LQLKQQQVAAAATSTALRKASELKPIALQRNMEGPEHRSHGELADNSIAVTAAPCGEGAASAKRCLAHCAAQRERQKRRAPTIRKSGQHECGPKASTFEVRTF
jgi:hypothetical protein